VNDCAYNLQDDDVIMSVIIMYNNNKISIKTRKILSRA